MESRSGDSTPSSHLPEDGATKVSPAPSTPRVVPESIGPYRVLGLLGEGGMGIVFEAEQDRPRRRVALKVIRGGQFVDDERVRLFQREVDTLARLKHPSIAAIYEAGHTPSGEHFFAMELVHGCSLDEFLKQRGDALNEREIRFRLRLFLTLCGAVSYAHQRGVIHRDLKPSNIFVSETGKEAESSRGKMPELKVLDFGLARITGSDVEAMTVMSEVGVIKGTLPYMSPEQVLGDSDRIDVRSDVYTLGIILQEMLTGRRPYEIASGSLFEAVRVITSHAPAPLRQGWKGSRPPDPDLQTIVGKALEKDVDRRYPSAAALAEDIERHLDSRPILARAPSTMYQVRKLVKRHRTLVGGIVATLIALIAGIVASTTFGLREATQRRAAEQAQHDTQAMVDFQAGMLSDVDARQVGRRLEADLSDRVAGAHRDAHASPAEVAAALASFKAEMTRINTTDAALRVIDENILARAIATSATQFANRPRIRAQLLTSIGVTYFKLGLLDRAEPPLLQSLSLSPGASTLDDPQPLATRARLADVYASQGRTQEAESLFVLALAGQRRVLGADHPDVMETTDGLATLYSDTERYSAAESLYAIVLPMMRRRQGVEDPRTLSCQANYAWTLISQDKFAHAESLAVSALQMDRKVLGNENKQTMDAANNLGVLYVHSGRPELAEPLYLEDLNTSRKLLGEEHPDVLVSMTNMGRLYNRLRKYPEAEAILRTAVATTRKVMPPGFMGLGISLLAHSEALIGLDRHREAEPEALEAYRILHALRGDADPGVQHAVKILVGVYEKTGRPDDAAKWKKKLPPEPKA